MPITKIVMETRIMLTSEASVVFGVPNTSLIVHCTIFLPMNTPSPSGAQENCDSKQLSTSRKRSLLLQV